MMFMENQTQHIGLLYNAQPTTWGVGVSIISSMLFEKFVLLGSRNMMYTTFLAGGCKCTLNAFQIVALL